MTVTQGYTSGRKPQNWLVERPRNAAGGTADTVPPFSTSRSRSAHCLGMTDQHMIRRAVTVRGAVQGVSFRWYTMQVATRLGVSGWVRNEPDGSVRLEVQGPERDVVELVDWVRHGPRLARVTEVQVQEQTPTSREDGFTITH